MASTTSNNGRSGVNGNAESSPLHGTDAPAADVNDIDIEERLAKTIEPPDGGWGWVIVFCSFAIHVIVDGITYSFGVVFVELLEDFNAGKGDTAWIVSIFVGLTLGSGPIASALVNLYSCRTVTMLGAVIGALGFVLSPFAPDVWYLYLSFGLVAGFGFGLIYLPAIVIVSYYFERRRALATGLACCGSGFGTFIFAPLSAYLVEEYGWKQTCFWLAAIILQCCIFGALFRPLPLIDNTESLKPEDNVVELNKNSASESHVGKSNISVAKPSSVTRSKISINQITSLSSLNRQPLQGHQLKQHIPLHRKDVFYSGSLHNIPLYSQNRAEYITSNMSLANSLHQAKGAIAASTEPRTKWEAFTSSFKTLIDFSLMKEWAFVLFLISNVFTNLGFNAPFLFIPDRAEGWGMNKQKAALLVSIVGIANTVGRILFGYVSDLKYIKPHRLHVYNTGLVIAGLATAFSSVNSYEAQIVYCVFFGVFIGCYVSLTAIILVDLLGVDKLTSSFGVTLLAQGVAVLVGPPICGWLHDATGSYTWPFAVTGSCIAVSGVMLYFIPLLTRTQRRRHTKAQVDLGVRIGVTEVGNELKSCSASHEKAVDKKLLSP